MARTSRSTMLWKATYDDGDDIWEAYAGSRAQAERTLLRAISDWNKRMTDEEQSQYIIDLDAVKDGLHVGAVQEGDVFVSDDPYLWRQ